MTADALEAPDEVPDALLRPAMEAAVEVAQAARAARPPLQPPRQLRPFVGLRRLPDRGLAPIRQALEADERFRQLVAASTTEDLVGRTSYLWLTRPDGWEAELRHRVAVERSEESAIADARARASDARRLEATEVALRKAQDELVTERADGARLREQLAEERRSRRSADSELGRLRRRIADLEERLAVAPVAEDAVADVALAAAVADRESLALEVARLRERLGSPSPGTAGDARPTERARRRPVTLPPAVFDDSPDAADHLVRVPGVVVLVDGYNVAMQARPDEALAEQRAWLVDAAGALSARSGAELHLVFDGDRDHGTAPAQGPRRATVHVHYTPAGREADDELLALVVDTPARRPVVVVSSDHRVAAGAIAVGANVLSSATFVALLRR